MKSLGREEKQRIARLLEQDKEEMNDETRAAATRDMRRVAQEYFELDGGVTLTVGRDKTGFSVAFSFRASRVKNFTALK